MLRWYDPHNGTGDVPVPRSCRKKGEWLFEDSLEKFCGATKYLLGLLRLTLFTIEKKNRKGQQRRAKARRASHLYIALVLKLRNEN